MLKGEILKYVWWNERSTKIYLERVGKEAEESQLQEIYGTNLNIFSVCY